MFQKKVCLVMNQMESLGAEMAHEFARQGFCIALMDQDKVAGEKLKKDITECYGAKAFFFHGDSKKSEDRIIFKNTVLEMYGRIDLIVP